jgi:hypothetical protein
MSNPIKYSTGSESLALKKGNFYIGTGDVGKGPTSTTGYYNGITPPSGGYTIYLNKATGGPSIYTCANDAELVNLTNSIAGTSYTTANECFVYFAGQTDKMVLNRDYEGIVTDGLVLNLDAGFTPSYPKNGTTWYDLSGNGNNVTLTNGPSFSSNNGGVLVFDGIDDYADIPFDSSLNNSNTTLSVWVKSTFVVGPSGRHYILDGVSHRTMIFVDEPNEINFVIVTSSGVKYAIYDNAITSQGTWLNIVGTYDGSFLKLYVNGDLKTTESHSGNINNADSTGRIMDYRANGYEVQGQAGTFMIYNRGLSTTEVLQNYNAQKGRFGL